MMNFQMAFEAQAVSMGLVLLMIFGCLPEPIVNDRDYNLTMQSAAMDSERFADSNPCGHIEVRKPFFNVSGFHTGEIKPNSPVYRFVAPNTTFEGAMFVVDRCPPIEETRTDSAGEFSFQPFPPGKYVVFTDPGSFRKGTQGYPIVREFRSGNFSLEIAFHGGDPHHSLVAFEIRQIS